MNLLRNPFLTYRYNGTSPRHLSAEQLNSLVWTRRDDAGVELEKHHALFPRLKCPRLPLAERC